MYYYHTGISCVHVQLFSEQFSDCFQDWSCCILFVVFYEGEIRRWRHTVYLYSFLCVSDIAQNALLYSICCVIWRWDTKIETVCVFVLIPMHLWYYCVFVLISMHLWCYIGAVALVMYSSQCVACGSHKSIGYVLQYLADVILVLLLQRSWLHWLCTLVFIQCVACRSHKSISWECLRSSTVKISLLAASPSPLYKLKIANVIWGNTSNIKHNNLLGNMFFNPHISYIFQRTTNMSFYACDHT